jgi:hypothetical protein
MEHGQSHPIAAGPPIKFASNQEINMATKVEDSGVSLSTHLRTRWTKRGRLLDRAAQVLLCKSSKKYGLISSRPETFNLQFDQALSPLEIPHCGLVNTN